ncbi:MAG: T9SS type A sorting domain-containing protein [Bacteroidota bacterium]
MKKHFKYFLPVFVFCTVNVFSATYTWNKTNGGQWNSATNWTPNAPAAGPPSGSDIIIPALGNSSRVITDVPQITLNSLICTGIGTSWLTAAATGNTVTISTTWNVPSSHTLTIGAASERLCWKLLNTSTSTIDGYVAFDAGSTNRNFDVYGTLIVNVNGCIFDPNPTGGSDFYFYTGCTLKTQKPQGFTTTAATSAATINYNVAVCTGGSYSYITGINFEFNGTADQITGMGLSQNTASNVVISSSPGKTVTLSWNTQLSGSLTINNNATFNASTYSLSIGAITGAGNFVNNGIFNSGTGAVTFNGNAAQTISGTATTTFNNLILNNANGLTLSTPAQLKGALTLTNGLLKTTSTDLLTLLSGATAPALTASSTSYINGPMKYQKSTSGSSTLNFPIGKSPDCRPIQLNVNHANTTTYNYLGESFNSSPRVLGYTKPASIDTVSNVHYWDITRTNSASVSQPTLDLASTQTVKLHFGSNDGVRDLTTLRVVKNTYTATTTWTDLAGGSFAGTTTVGNITSAGFNSFSRFTIAGNAAGANPLPITLTNFSGVCMDKYIQLNWTTATERNNDYFIIERSEDGYNWENIIQVKGSGTSNTNINYFYDDFSNTLNLPYYRISQVDFNGKITRHSIISVICNNATDRSIVFPNPFSREHQLKISIKNNKSKTMTIKIFESTGKLVYNTLVQRGEDSDLIELTDVNLPSGVYIIDINNEISKLIVM